MNVSPLVRKVSFGGHQASESLFLNAAASGIAIGPAATAYQPFVVDRTIGSPKSEPKRLASPIASSTSWRLAKTIQRPLPDVSSGPADDEGGAITNHMPMAAVSQKANEKTNLPMPKRLETRSRIVAKSRGLGNYYHLSHDNLGWRRNGGFSAHTGFPMRPMEARSPPSCDIQPSVSVCFVGSG
jgi:hypothetical protein